MFKRVQRIRPWFNRGPFTPACNGQPIRQLGGLELCTAVLNGRLSWQNVRGRSGCNCGNCQMATTGKSDGPGGTNDVVDRLQLNIFASATVASF
ncbi:hypothetical protein T08_14830 [Trichinella sp. T8]|nr:hypothetical protein T08_14830 [Trichinella sp. T8]